MYTTIRKNSLKRIRELLDKAILIKSYNDDGMDVTCHKHTVDEVMKLSDRFDRVYVDERGILTIALCMTHMYTAYPSIEAARHSLTRQAFAKYFPDQDAAPAARKHTIGATSTDTTKFIYDPSGELVATVRAPDDNRAGIEFARSNAERIIAALNAAPAVDSDGDYEADCEGQEAARAERDYQ